MNIGTLDFEIVANKEMLSKSLEEAKASLKNFTDAAKAGGADAQQAMVAASAQIEAAWDKLSGVGEENRQALKSLEKEYAELSQKAGEAFQKATAEGDKEYRALTERQAALGKEIQQRKSVLREVEKLTDELQQEEDAYNKLAEKTAKNEARTTSFRQQMRELREEMAMQEMQARETGGETAVMALRGSDAFKAMQSKVAMLTDAMGDATRQAQLLSHDNQGLQGVISAVSGVAGAMSVAQGAVGMFAGENENLQKIMTRVQSIMAITTGLQQVADTLNKDSATSLTVFNKARETFVLEMQRGNAALEVSNTATAAGTTATQANTAATAANAAAEQRKATATAAATAAQGKNTAATAANTATTGANTVANAAAVTGINLFRRANILLSASFKAVGTAIKSIPVIGWILAGVSALIGVIRLLTKSSREAKEAQEEYYKAVAEGAKEPVAQIESLAAKWNALGNDMAAKQKFVEDNAAAFEELGAKVTNVNDAEALLVKNKDAFINAQIAKSKALAATNKAAELQAERLELQLEKEDALANGRKGKARRRQRDIDELDEQIKDLYGRAVEAERVGAEQLTKTGVQAAKTYAQGTVGWYEQAIQAKQALLKDLSDPKQYQQAQKEIAAMQKTLDGITGTKPSGGSGSTKDPYLARLEKRKKAYADYAKWANGTDEILQGAANKQYENLLKDGKDYLDYLTKQRDALMEKMVGNGTRAQQKQLQTLNEQIAEETRTTILEEFDRQIERQLNGANSLLEKLAVIERERKRLANESGYVADEERKRLTEEAQQVATEMQKEYDDAKQEYYDYLDGKLSSFERYQRDMEQLEKKLASTSNSGEISAILKQMDTLTQRQTTATAQSYDALVAEYATFEQKKTDLQKEYDEKRRLATQQGNTELLNRINEDYKKQLQLMVDEYLDNDVISKALEVLDEVTVEALDKLISDIEGNKIELPADVKEKDIDRIIKKLWGMRNEIAANNPFMQLKLAFNDLRAAISNGDVAAAAANVGAAMGAVGQVTSQVSQAIEGMEGDAAEAIKTVLDSSTMVVTNAGVAITSIATLAKSAVEGEAAAAEGASAAVKTVETASVILAVISAALQVIQGVVKAITYFTNKAEEKRLEEYENKVKGIERAYADLERQISRTYSAERYELERNAIELQRQELQAKRERLAYLDQLRANDDKDFDQDEYDALLQEIAEGEDAINQALDEYAEDITQTTIPEIGDEITDALVNAFAEGMSDAEINETIEKLVNDMMKNAAIQMAKAELLMPAIKDWYENFKAAMESDGELTEEERDRLQAEALAATQAFQERIREINAMFGEAEGDASTLSGAIKGASQESIDLLAGYTNAVRINLIEVIGLFGRQLSLMASVDGRMANAVEYLDMIYRRMGVASITNQTIEQQAIDQRPYGIIDE